MAEAGREGARLTGAGFTAAHESQPLAFGSRKGTVFGRAEERMQISKRQCNSSTVQLIQTADDLLKLRSNSAWRNAFRVPLYGKSRELKRNSLSTR